MARYFQISRSIFFAILERIDQDGVGQLPESLVLGHRQPGAFLSLILNRRCFARLGALGRRRSSDR